MTRTTFNQILHHMGPKKWPPGCYALKYPTDPNPQRATPPKRRPDDTLRHVYVNQSWLIRVRDLAVWESAQGYIVQLQSWEGYLEKYVAKYSVLDSIPPFDLAKAAPAILSRSRKIIREALQAPGFVSLYFMGAYEDSRWVWQSMTDVEYDPSWVKCGPVHRHVMPKEGLALSGQVSFALRGLDSKTYGGEPSPHPVRAQFQGTLRRLDPLEAMYYAVKERGIL